MSELSKYKDTDRVIFPSGKQSDFFLYAKNRAGISWTIFAKILDVNPRMLLNYRNEKYSITFKILKTIIENLKVEFPKDINIEDQFWHNNIAGRLGGKTVMKKYGKVGGNEKYRKEQWRKWWETSGIKNPNLVSSRREVKLPVYSSSLAELFGILIGDGGITKYQMTITLNGVTDKKYSRFIVILLKKLFDENPKIYKIRGTKAINVVISRSGLVDFLVKNGLKIGHKINQNVTIPEWIMMSEKYRISCLRGLVDTDGCVVHETHRIQDKKYVYPRLNFTSASPNLVQQVISIFSDLGFKTKLRRGGRSVQLENLREICQYFNIVGSSNPKHLKRISRWY